MLNLKASKQKKKEQLLKYNLRIKDEYIDEVVDIIVNMAEKEFQEKIKERNYKFEDILDFEKLKYIFTLFIDYFHISEGDPFYFGIRDTISYRYMRGNRDRINKRLEKYIVSDKLTDKEIKRLDKVFTIMMILSGHIFYFPNRPTSGYDKVFHSGIKALKTLKFVSHSRFNSYNRVRNNNQLAIDKDIYKRATNYFTQEYRYDYYERFIEEWNNEYEGTGGRSDLVNAINNFEEKVFSDTKITFI